MYPQEGLSTGLNLAESSGELITCSCYPGSRKTQTPLTGTCSVLRAGTLGSAEETGESGTAWRGNNPQREARENAL